MYMRKAALSMPTQKLQTRLLVREGTPHQRTRNCLNKFKSNYRLGNLMPGGFPGINKYRNLALQAGGGRGGLKSRDNEMGL
jgi:hypothetical protein